MSFGLCGFPACPNKNVGINNWASTDHFHVFSVNVSVVIISFSAIKSDPLILQVNINSKKKIVAYYPAKCNRSNTV
jgi:hypothetical protein